MNSDYVRPVALVALVVIAFGVAAATLDAGSLPEDAAETPNATDQERTSGGSGTNGTDLGFSPTLQCPVPTAGGLAFAAVAGAILLFAGVAYWARRSPVLPAVVGAPVLAGLVAVCPSTLPPVPFDRVVPSPAALGAGLLAALLAALAFVYATTGTDVAVEDETDDGVNLAAVGAAAGAAADRIESDADVENEVYRAWLEMTRLLDVPNPEATAPDEFADAAVAAGMDPDDVDTLTRLFEEVRYGGFDAESREDAAVAALRRIERTYAGDER